MKVVGRIWTTIVSWRVPLFLLVLLAGGAFYIYRPPHGQQFAPNFVSASQVYYTWAVVVGLLIAFLQYASVTSARKVARAEEFIARFNAPDYAEVKTRAARAYREFIEGSKIDNDRLTHYRSLIGYTNYGVDDELRTKIADLSHDDRKKRIADFYKEKLGDQYDPFCRLNQFECLDGFDAARIRDAENGLFGVLTVLNFMNELGYAYKKADVNTDRTLSYFRDMAIGIWTKYESFIMAMRIGLGQAPGDYYYSDFEYMFTQFVEEREKARKKLEKKMRKLDNRRRSADAKMKETAIR